MKAARSSVGEFTVSVTYGGAHTVLGVLGEVDILTAAELGSIMDAVIDRGHRSVVLDLARCEFMDATGLRVIASGAGRLRASDDALTIRSPSTMVLRMLDVTAVAGMVRLEYGDGLPGHLGPEQEAGAPGTSIGAEPGGVLRHLREVTAVPANDDVVDGALRLVVALARATVGGADGVSVSLRRHGHLATVAATDQTISDMDAGQYATQQGPCVAASMEGRWFHVESLDTETRWPEFIPRAKALGINAILSTPLVSGDRPMGALNVYSRTVRAFAPKDQELAAVFATEASTVLAHAGVDVTEDELSSRLGEALRARQDIAQAQGIIMARDGVDEDGAYTVLRRLSLGSGRPLRSEAQAVRDGARRSPPETDRMDGASP